MRFVLLAALACLLGALLTTDAAAGRLDGNPFVAAAPLPSGQRAVGPPTGRATAPRRWAKLRGTATRRLAEREFPALVGHATGAPTSMPKGMRIDRPLSETTAKLETATGNPAGVAVFSQPVATKVDGQLRTLDLDLVRRGGALESRLPGVEVSYPQRASGEV